MSLVGQYSPSLFQEVFVLLHEVVAGCTVEDWSAVTVCLHAAAAYPGRAREALLMMCRAESEPLHSAFRLPRSQLVTAMASTDAVSL